MKISILTITDDENYGNRLQNYALEQVILKETGVEVFTIWPAASYIKRFLKNIRFVLKKGFTQYRRMRVFQRFTKVFTHRKYIGYSDAKNDSNLVIIGSDQILNLKWQLFRLEWILNSNKKFYSYAASFGVNEIEESKISIYKNILKRIEHLSIREERGKEIVMNLINVNADVHIDPTMLLSDKEWDLISLNPKKMPAKKYILNYFLGDLSVDNEDKIKKLAKDNDCEIINIMNPSDPYFVNGPRQFVYLVKNSFCVCTDSFHACVFSIIFKKIFVVFNRIDKKEDNMSSRLDTLLNTFNFKDRLYKSGELSQYMNIDYANIDLMIENEKEKSISYLLSITNTIINS